MGVLDDAIREHLDLKRARGGDPAEIERMEREALGPVRREPTIGSARFEVAEERPPAAFERAYEDDVLDLEELQDLGYHDSTAPHPHPHRVEHDRHHDLGEPHLEHDRRRLAAEPDETERPRRRFLRRNRGSSPPEPQLPDPGFPEDEPALESHELLPHHEAFDYHDPLERDDALEHDDQGVRGTAAEFDDVTGQAGSTDAPPHLRFDHPPARPRFTAEPPSTPPDDDQDPAIAHEPPADAMPAPAPVAPEPAPLDEPPEHPEPRETTEFDVQRHIAETRHQPDDEPPTREHAAAPQPDAPADEDADEDEAADEDVLEETPEFLQDTPEHDRLWFEQRPPKDFDFDG
jgi:hypothetical protein